MEFKPDLWRPTGFLQYFDTVGLVMWPVKIIPEMTYNVSSGTLNLYTTKCGVRKASAVMIVLGLEGQVLGHGLEGQILGHGTEHQSAWMSEIKNVG